MIPLAGRPTSLLIEYEAEPDFRHIFLEELTGAAPRKMDGQLREVMVATSEMNMTERPESSRKWIDEKLICSHGYGVTDVGRKAR